MAGRLEGKTALITAAGQGIGHATALAMAGEGAHGDRDRRRTKRSSRRCRRRPTSRARKLDVLDDAAVAALIGELPPLQILFNCAGYVHHGTILDCSPKDWDFSFNLNVRAMYVAIRAALPKMLAHHESTGQGASIINMASIAGSIKGLPNRFVYGASKAAVVGLTKAVAADFVQRGIRCNAIAPGTVDTPSLARAHQRVSRSGRGAQDVRRAPADGTARQARGDRADRRVPRVGRSGVRHRQHLLVDGGMTI